MNCYIHVPFCKSKCGYCAFYSETGANENIIEEYLEKLIRDISSVKPFKPQTIYIGGGTPTLLSAAQLQYLFESIKRYLAPDKECEISIECNPETLTAEKCSVLQEHISRISLGVQSFDDTLRDTLGRKCSKEALNNALNLIRESKIPHFNCDLIYGIPGETLELWKNDLENVISAGVDHVSCYSLTPEEQSRLGATFIIDDDAAVEMYQTAGKILSRNGIERYEISNYAKRGAECRHNVNVWKGGKLIAFGPAGAGFDGTQRTVNPESICCWLNGDAPENDELPEESRCREIFAVNLRTVSGWNRELWQHKNFSWDKMREIFSSAMESIPNEFYIITNDTIRLTADGLLYWNDIAERIIL